jgi:2,4-dienoyl-CoA reductase-like NADH-dependent reductase (Old Yellow Enzyme family)
MHVGRWSHPDNTPHHRQPAAAIAPGADVHRDRHAGHSRAARPDNRGNRPEIAKLNLAYLHIMHTGNEELLADIRNPHTDPQPHGTPARKIGADVEAGLADLEDFGQMILANPDFIERIKTSAPLNNADRATLFGGGANLESELISAPEGASTPP